MQYPLIALVLAWLAVACTPERPVSDGRTPPDGWFLSGSSATQFRAVTDPTAAHTGRASARLEALAADVDGAATLMQSIPPDAYRGKRVRFSGFVATDDVRGWTGLWMRVDQPDGHSAFDNMQDRAIHGTTAWAPHEVVLDVAADASALHFGLVQDGPGVSHLDDAALEVVGADVRVTEIDPRPRDDSAPAAGDGSDARALANGDFETGDPELRPWFVTGEAQSRYEAVLDHAVKHGKASARLKTLPGTPGGYGVLMQSIQAVDYRGQRIRVTAAVKTRDASGDLWIRVQAASSPADGSGLASASHLLTGTADWRTYESVIDVPLAGDSIEIGAGLRGRGTLWLDDVRLELVGRDVALTPQIPGPGALVNGDFEAGAGEQTEGWFLSGGASGEFEATIDRTEHAAGEASARLRPRVARPGGYGTLMQAILADDYRGKRLRMTSLVKGKGITGRGDLWLRVQAAYSPGDGPGLGGGSCPMRDSFAWQPCEITFDVPEAGESIQLGIGLAGPGTLWLDQVRLEEVSRNVPATGVVRARTQPINLDFEAQSQP